MMRWLGIHVPRWLANDLAHSVDILESSVRACRDMFADLHDYAARKSIPIGINVESLAIRKDEIAASERLVRELGAQVRV